MKPIGTCEVLLGRKVQNVLKPNIGPKKHYNRLKTYFLIPWNVWNLAGNYTISISFSHPLPPSVHNLGLKDREAVPSVLLTNERERERAKECLCVGYKRTQTRLGKSNI